MNANFTRQTLLGCSILVVACQSAVMAGPFHGPIGNRPHPVARAVTRNVVAHRAARPTIGKLVKAVHPVNRLANVKHPIAARVLNHRPIALRPPFRRPGLGFPVGLGAGLGIGAALNPGWGLDYGPAYAAADPVPMDMTPAAPVETVVPADSKPMMKLGQSYTIANDNFGTNPGNLALQVNGVTLPVKVDQWDAQSISFTLPTLGLNQTSDGVFEVVNADQSSTQDIPVMVASAE